jgi:hypothetical protein
MQAIVGGRAQGIQLGARPRFARVSVRDSAAAAMLRGCPVVSASGNALGLVEQLVIEVHTHQLRYVVLSAEAGSGAEIAVPWKTLYFDSAMARLVFCASL